MNHKNIADLTRDEFFELLLDDPKNTIPLSLDMMKEISKAMDVPAVQIENNVDDYQKVVLLNKDIFVITEIDQKNAEILSVSLFQLERDEQGEILGVHLRYSATSVMGTEMEENVGVGFALDNHYIEALINDDDVAYMDDFDQLDSMGAMMIFNVYKYFQEEMD